MLFPRFFRRPFWLTLIVAAFACSHPVSPTAAAWASSAAESAVAFVGVNLVDVHNARVLPSQTVVTAGGRISAVGANGTVSIPRHARRIDARGKYLMPGLVDMHVHLRAPGELISYLRWGVTTIVHMSGAMPGAPDLLRYRGELREGERIGPALYLAGPNLDGEHPSFPNVSVALTWPEEAVQEVRRQKRSGYNFVKIYNGLSNEVFRAVAAEAKRQQIPFVGHVPRQGGLELALGLGQSLIAHSDEYFFTFFKGPRSTSVPMREIESFRPDYSRLPEAARLTRAAGAAVTPNLSFIEATRRMIEEPGQVYRDPELRYLEPGVVTMWKQRGPQTRQDLPQFRARERIRSEFAARLTLALLAAGVPVLLGTDSSAPGLFPGKSAHLELERLVAAGMTPAQALQAATSHAGAFLRNHVSDKPMLGQIREGYRADLVLLDADPLEKIGNAALIEGVLRAGHYYPVAELDRLRSR